MGRQMLMSEGLKFDILVKNQYGVYTPDQFAFEAKNVGLYARLYSIRLCIVFVSWFKLEHVYISRCFDNISE